MSGAKYTAGVTVGEIARRVPTEVHRVLYQLRRLAVKPVAVAGRYRLFGDDDAQKVIAEIRRVDAARTSMDGTGQRETDSVES